MYKKLIGNALIGVMLAAERAEAAPFEVDRRVIAVVQPSGDFGVF